MSIYFTKGKGWRYDFTLSERRFTKAGFKTKASARKAEAQRKEEILNPKKSVETQTDMVFLELVNKRLDFLQAYRSERYYVDYVYLAKRWVKKWGKLNCSEVSTDIVQAHLIKRSKVSAVTANTELRYLKAVFNFGIKRKWIAENPTNDIEFFPVEKKEKYIPPLEDVIKVILAADFDTQDYLYVIKETIGRVGEINRLKWSDVSFEGRYVVLYTRKKKGGHLTPRKVPMTEKLYDVLLKRYQKRDTSKPWVFWHRYWSAKEKKFVEAPYKDRKRLMNGLCAKAGVRYFRYHALRHLGASVLDSANVNIGAIQRILGHENRTTTEIYLHSIGESEREAMKVFEEVSKKVSHFSHTFSQ